jgi:hypothetical protein
MRDLPKFRPRPYEHVQSLMAKVFLNERVDEETQLVEVIAYEDGHYRAVFTPSYFILAEGQGEPSKSQWNTLKKHAKRYNEHLFVFKEYGEVECSTSPRCYYLDFGFFDD